MAARHASRGFTLVELLLVMALIVLCAAMVTPAFSGRLSRVRLDAAAEEVRNAWGEARLKAMRSGESVAFQCRLGTGTYLVSSLTEAAATLSQSEGDTLADDDRENLGDIRFTQLTLGDPALDPAIDPQVAACVVFRPDGATDDAIAVLTADDGRTRTVRLRGLTGSATIEDTALSEGG